jgi:hypothetical protein
MSNEVIMQDAERVQRLYRELGLEAGSKYRNGTNGAIGSGGLVRITKGDLKWLLDRYEDLENMRAVLQQTQGVEP